MEDVDATCCQWLAKVFLELLLGGVVRNIADEDVHGGEVVSVGARMHSGRSTRRCDGVASSSERLSKQKEGYIKKSPVK